MRSLPRLWYLLLGVFVAALVGCTGEPTGSLESAETIETTAPVVGADDESQAFPIELLEGVPLLSPSGLVLLSGDTIIDVDADSERRVDGLPEGEDLVLWTVDAGKGAVVMVDCHVECGAPEVFAVDDQSGVARSVAIGFPAPAPDGVWVKQYVSETTCTLAKVSLDGTTLEAERPFDCDISVVEETPMGLIVAMTQGRPEQGAILNPETLDTLLETGRIHAVIEDQVLSWKGDSFTLLDRATDTLTDIAPPTDIGEPSYGRISPDGRFIAIPFEHPAWPGPRQRLDVWVLEVATLEWTRLPSMPVVAALKATHQTWAPDGRFVMFGSFDQAGHAVVAWRPGDRDLAIRQLDADPSGSLVVWTTTTP